MVKFTLTEFQTLKWRVSFIKIQVEINVFRLF